MGTRMSFFDDGRWVEFPNDGLEAYEFGWHVGVRLPLKATFDGRIDALDKWCRENFGSCHHYVCLSTIWFYREEDAMLCRLRWSA